MNHVRHGVSTVHTLYMRYQKRKPWKKISSQGFQRYRPTRTRESKLRSYPQRQECPQRDQTRRQGTTSTQMRKQRFQQENKQLLEPELPSDYLTTPTEG